VTFVTNQGAAATAVEFLFLPGLADVVTEELRNRLPGLESLGPVPGRSDSLAGTYLGDWRRLLQLSTVVAPYLVLTFPVPRPRSLTSSEYLPGILRAVERVQRVNREAMDTFRLDAAGADSAGYQQLATQLEQATGLAQVAEGGDLLLRFRRSADHPGWDVLIRISARPLSARLWRTRSFPGAANATIASAMSMMTSPAPTDRVVNLMCGSGTLLIERLLLQPARVATAVDVDQDAVELCAENLDAADLNGRARLVKADIADEQWMGGGPYDVILADPPWGTLMGEHESNAALHSLLLERAHAAAAPGARMAVLTHEVRIMENCLRQAAEQWTQRDVVRVFQKGHHPRIYLLEKR
jgi:tRNA (guanine6-N2)-methyltransferase